MRVTAALRQAVQRLGFFERCQVLALDVLDQREFEHLGFVDVADHRRQLVEPGLDRRLVAALAGDDLEAAGALPDHQRLENSLLGDRRDQLRQVPHHLPRLVGVRIDLLDRDEPANGDAGRRGERIHVVLVVPHGNGVGQTASRHDR